MRAREREAIIALLRRLRARVRNRDLPHLADLTYGRGPVFSGAWFALDSAGYYSIRFDSSAARRRRINSAIDAVRKSDG